MAAVGRLNLDGAGFCTGALIAPDQVMTAAHCLFDPDTGEELAVGRVHFSAGLRGNRSAAYRNAKAIYVHPAYDFDGLGKLQRVAVDLAIVELERPLRSATAQPFDFGGAVALGDKLSLMSYADEHADHLDVQDHCDVMRRVSGVATLSCYVTSGASGAPVFDSEMNLVAVISAKAERDGVAVSLSTVLTDALPALMDSLVGP